MSKLFDFVQAKGKQSKSTSLDPEGWAKSYKNFTQKLLAVSLCMAITTMGVPLGRQSVHVADATTTTTSPSKTFVTKEDLLELCSSTNDGNGLLATGTDSDVPLRLRFGHRLGNVKFYPAGYDCYTPSDGDVSWLVAGSDADDSIVLFSELPALDGHTIMGDVPIGFKDPDFVESSDPLPLTADGGSYAGAAPSSVFANHWGMSYIRSSKQAPRRVGSTFLSLAEGALMSKSLITTRDWQTGTGVPYTTEDWFYPPATNESLFFDGWPSEPIRTVTVGSDDSLLLHGAYWSSYFWLRSPWPQATIPRVADAKPGTGLMLAVPSHLAPQVGSSSCAYTWTWSFACRLSLSSVLFAAAAPTSGSGFGDFPDYRSSYVVDDIDPATYNYYNSYDDYYGYGDNSYPAMTLRLNGSDQNMGTAKVNDDFTEISVTGANGSTVVIQGDDWYYREDITSDETLALSVTDFYVDLDDFDGCNVWLEKPIENGGTLTYAVLADWPYAASADFLEATVNVNGTEQRILVGDPYGVLPDDTYFSAEFVDGAHGNHNFFVKYVDPTDNVEKNHFYNLTLTSGGQTLSQLDGPVELWFEAIDGLDAADSFISRVTEGEDAKLEPTVYDDEDGVTWIVVETDHFSPYALTDLLSPGEKIANIVSIVAFASFLILALGILLRVFIRRKKLEE